MRKLTSLHASDILFVPISLTEERWMPQGTPVKHKKRSKSVFKNIRKSAHRAIANRANRTRVRSALRTLRAAIASGDATAAQGLLPQTVSEVDRAVKNRTLHANTANRYKSRLAHAIHLLRQPKKA
jgi:small subunit ribosomal protein S20